MAVERKPGEGASSGNPKGGSATAEMDVSIDSVDSCTRTDNGGDADPSLFGRILNAVLEAIGLRDAEEDRQRDEERICKPDDDDTP